MLTVLSKEHRNLLARVTLNAREVSERAARAALENLAVHERDYRQFMTMEQRQLRNRLRARGRALGDPRDERVGTQRISQLTEDVAYEQWHRLLFTRFLAENGLLHTDETHGSVPVTLEECDELAPELGARDGFDLACRFASRTLPGVFRPLDPVLDLRLAPNDEVKLRELLDSLPAEVFRSDDALGWTYQFWQAERKDEINASSNKIGPDELPAVTQLFTEDYMVDFLLDNTLGAWHAGKALAAKPTLAETAQSEEELRNAMALPGCPWEYLRFIKAKDGKWTPAAGVFDGWPKAAKQLKCLDPCMGSGHFVVAMFQRVVAMRIAEEKLDEAASVVAVIRDNLFGLEIDPRCTQIGAFNLALAAWRRVGHRPLPAMNLACSGLAPNATKEDWLKLAGDNDRLKLGMARLFALFQDAPMLGSLINPRATEGDLLEAGFHELQPLLEKALARETKDTTHEMAVTALGLAKAAELLASQFTLIATNVPFLGRRKQAPVLKDYCDRVHPEAKPELATCFIERSLDLCGHGGAASLLAPQNWLFLGTFEPLRQKLLYSTSWDLACRLGSKAFQTPMYDFGVVMHIFATRTPTAASQLAGLDVGAALSPTSKAIALPNTDVAVVSQHDQLRNPDTAIVFAKASRLPLLLKYADSLQGSGLADIIVFRRFFWELEECSRGWVLHQSSPDGVNIYSGMHFAVKWDDGQGPLAALPEARIQGRQAWGKNGVACAWLGRLPAGLYLGTLFDNSAAAIVPRDPRHLASIWCFVSSSEFVREVRRINQKAQVANATLVKVPFDLTYWQKVAADRYPDGLPKPFSSDPTQWLFNGHPKDSDQPLHVAVARLLGYRWPRQTGAALPECPAVGSDGLEAHAAADAIVCLSAINREQPAAARLRALLAASVAKLDERSLIGGTGSPRMSLEDWLRDDFFQQHCNLFHQRPFVWHIWDGRKDGFHAFVNYHRLDVAGLKKLTYSYLGEWIRQQESDAKADRPGAAERLGAARDLQQELVRILEGEPPYDIFVRWKPLAEQALGWNPDLNDGVRLNIRPFLVARDVGKKGAGVLRAKPNIKWDKDRGKEPHREKADFPWFWCEDEPGTDPEGGKAFVGDRWNSTHLSFARKRNAPRRHSLRT